MKVILVAVILFVCCDLSFAALGTDNSGPGDLLGLSDDQAKDPNQMNTALTGLLPANNLTNANDTEALSSIATSLGNGTSNDKPDILNTLNDLPISDTNSIDLSNTSSLLNSTANLPQPPSNGIVSGLDTGLNNFTTGFENISNQSSLTNVLPPLNASGTNGVHGLFDNFENSTDLGNFFNSSNSTSQSNNHLSDLYSSLQKPMTPSNLQNISNIFQNIANSGQNGSFGNLMNLGENSTDDSLMSIVPSLGLKPSDQQVLEDFIKNLDTGKYTAIDLLDPNSLARHDFELIQKIVQNQPEEYQRRAIEAVLLLSLLRPHV